MVPVTVQIDHYTVSLGAFASLDPGRAPSQNVQVSLTPVPDPEGRLRQVLLFGLDLASIHLTSGEEPIGEGPTNRL